MMRKLVFFMGALCIMMGLSSSAFAFGFGAYGNFNGGKIVWEGSGVDHLAAGGGLVIDTNLASDMLFNYRLELGAGAMWFNNTTTEWVLYFPITSTEKIKTVTLFATNYFGFGVVRSKYVRLWLGPQIILGGMLTDVKGLLAGVGLAVGLNFNIGETFTISLVGSGRYVGGVYFVKESNGGLTGYGGYGGDGMVTLSFIFRVGHDFHQ